MAVRPVFISVPAFPFYKKVDIDFEWFPGFSVQQKQRSIASLHREFLKKHSNRKVLEISTKGTAPIGVKLSAFNLKYNLHGKMIFLECIFQGGKKFKNGGPYTDLYDAEPRDAKRDPRLKDSGKLDSFILEGQIFPLTPVDYFYNWIYSKALYDNKTLLEEVRKMDYNSFTDIEFNPQKSINCQARALAIFKGLDMAGLLDNAMSSNDAYLKYMLDPITNNNDDSNRYTKKIVYAKFKSVPSTWQSNAPTNIMIIDRYSNIIEHIVEKGFFGRDSTKILIVGDQGEIEKAFNLLDTIYWKSDSGQYFDASRYHIDLRYSDGTTYKYLGGPLSKLPDVMDTVAEIIRELYKNAGTDLIPPVHR